MKCRSLGYDCISIPLSVDEDFVEVADELRKHSNLYISFNVRKLTLETIPSLARRYHEALVYLRDCEDYFTQTRICLTIRGPLSTPYFPSASYLGSKPYYSVALLYADYLYENRLNIPEAILAAYNGVVGSLLKELEDSGLEFRGVDLSISPWMEESAAKLVLEDNGISLLKIFEVNNVLRSIAEKVKACGFNELMLPLAEDNVLKALVEEGKIKARDFIYYSSVCVAGVDMVPLPKADDGKLLRYIKWTLMAALVKNRVYGIRLIYTNSRSGEKIELGKFLETPVTCL